jgi:hypothetical protein
MYNDQLTSEEKKVKRNAFKVKLASFTQMQQMYSILRTERENILKIKNMAPDGKLPRGLLMQGK